MPSGTKQRRVAMPADAKLINRQMVLGVLRRGQPVTVAEIHEITGISRPTAMKTLQHYCEMGVARSLGLGESTNVGGKKPELFSFCDERRILCINLWPGSIAMGLCGLIGDVESTRAFPLADISSLDAAFEQLCVAADTYLRECGCTRDDLYGVMLSVPGTVDYDRQMLRYNSHAPEWGTNVMLGERLRALFGAEKAYFVGNAGKSTGRAILIDQPSYAGQRVMTLFTTWGISACMIERGHVLNGRDSLIGEIGHMVISDHAGAPCGCGKTGCLESLVSLAHVREMLRGMGAQDLCAGLTIGRLFELSSGGNAHAQEVVRYLAHCFAVALHNLSLAYNHEAVVIQGDYAWADPLFDRTLRGELAQFRYYPSAQEPFAIIYDRRDISLLALRGGAQVIKTRYFASLE